MKSEVFNEEKMQWENQEVDDIDGIVLFMTITPEMAKIFLSKQHNRPLSNSKVDMYARDMRLQRWKIGNDVVVFDIDGVNINAQHRLRAIVKANLAQRLMVRFGAQREEQEAMDIGPNRTLHDVAVLSGEEISKFGTSIGRYIKKQTCTGSIRGHNSTRQDDLSFIRHHKDALEWASNLLKPKIPKAQRALVPPVGNDVASAFARAYYHCKDDRIKLMRLEQFGQSLVHAEDYNLLAISGDTKDSSFSLFVRVLFDLQGNQGQVGRDARYKKAEKALHLFIEGRQVSILRTDNKELFPLPVEIEARKAKKR